MKETIKSIREFNRFYVNLMGILKNNFFDLDYSLTEARIIFEIGAKENLTARDIKNMLFIDEGYLSRLINGLIKKEIICKEKSNVDQRLYFLSLTTKGSNILQIINDRADSQLEHIISKINNKDQTRIAEIMVELKEILENIDRQNNISII